MQTDPLYQYRETDNQPNTFNNYSGQFFGSYPQGQSLEQQQYNQGTPGMRQQLGRLQPNVGLQESSGFTARQADDIYPQNQFNPSYQGHIPNSGYIFRPLEKKRGGSKRWSGNYRQNPGSRHYTPPPNRNRYIPEHYQAPWQQPNQVYNNSSLWAGTALPLRQW